MVEKAGLFIGHLGDGYGELVGGDLKNIDVIEVLFQE